MSYDLFAGDPYDDQAKVIYLMQLFAQCRPRRMNFEQQWEEEAALYWPEYRNSFSFGHAKMPGGKQTQFQVDSTGSIASHKFMAIAESVGMPSSIMWSVLRASDDSLMRDRAVATYYHDVTTLLWKQRYRPEGNFLGENRRNLQGLGVFGNCYLWVDDLDLRPDRHGRGNRYISCSIGEIYLLTDYQGRVTGCIRHFRRNARQAMDRWKEKCPPPIVVADTQNSQQLFDFLEFVIPRADYRPEAFLSVQGKPYMSCTVAVQGLALVEESGYRSFPMPSCRYQVAPEEDYGRGPGGMVLPEAKTLNSEKSDYLEQGHHAGAPGLIIGDDNLMGFKNQPRAIHYGGFNEDGKLLVAAVPHGDIQVTKEMMDESKAIILDAFLVNYYPLLFDRSGQPKSAREVIEMAHDRGVFLAPMLGCLYVEYLPGLVERELDQLSYMGLMPEMPDALKEADGQYETVWTSPLMRALSGNAISGYMRSAEIAQKMVEVTGDQSWTDRFSAERAMPAISEDQFVPPAWMATDAEAAAKAKGRADAAKRQEDVQALPGRAAIAKAQAIMAKAQAGQNIGGTLSGTPEGGMPMMPGQEQPGGRAFGQPGVPA